MQSCIFIFSRKAILIVRSAGLVLIALMIGISTVLGQPAAPTGLSAYTISTTSIALAWTDNANNESGLNIEQSLDGITFSQIGSTSSNVTVYTAANLSPAIKYYYRVYAFNGSGNSAYSNTNSAVTLTPWNQWQMTNFTATQLTNAGISGMEADPAADGVPNLVKYGLGQNPWIPASGPLAAGGIVSNALALTYNANEGAVDVLFGANISSDLTEWASGSNFVTGPMLLATNAGLVAEQLLADAPVTSALQQFMQLTVTYNGVPDSWTSGPPLPVALVEMASVWLGNKLYETGMYDAYNPNTTSPLYVYDITSNTWTRLLPERPYEGNHEAMETYNGKIYIIGGLDEGQGQVQIYDPTTNGWSLGAPMPYPAGACAAALISGKIYVAGGIVGEVAGSNSGYSTNAAAVYDPVSNSWTSLPPEPYPLNHVAYGTDGTNFFLFSGRDDGEAPANGTNIVQIYYPSSNSWVTSADPGSTLAPVPQARGAMGRACYYNGDFYVMGGETVNGAGATADRVYNRVDIYNVSSNTWRLGTPMPTAEHSICGASRGNRIYVAGGGLVAGVSYSSLFDIYILP